MIVIAVITIGTIAPMMGPKVTMESSAAIVMRMISTTKRPTSLLLPCLGSVLSSEDSDIVGVPVGKGEY